MVTIDIVVKSVVLLERSSGLAISSGEASQDEEYVLIKTRKSEKKNVQRVSVTPIVHKCSFLSLNLVLKSLPVTLILTPYVCIYLRVSEKRSKVARTDEVRIGKIADAIFFC